jgi:hypothetical protein
MLLLWTKCDKAGLRCLSLIHVRQKDVVFSNLHGHGHDHDHGHGIFICHRLAEDRVHSLGSESD